MIKYIFYFSFFCLTILILSSFFNFKISEKRKLASKIASELSEKYEKKYGLQFCGISEAAPKGKYENLGIDFFIFKKISIAEGRKILIEIEADFLDQINSSKSLKKHLLVYPFKGDNIVINIYSRPNDEPELYFPDYRVFSIYNSTLHFGFRELNEDGSKTNLKFNVEAKEEALKILDNIE